MFHKKIKKKIKIDGMHCKHCAKKVEDTLLAIDNISKVKVNLEDQSAVITLKEDVKEDILKEKIESLDYKFIKVEEV